MSRCGCRGRGCESESNVRYLVEHILYEMLENGEIKPDLRDCNGECIGDKYVATCEYINGDAYIRDLKKKLGLISVADVEAIVNRILHERSVPVDIEDTFGTNILEDNLVGSSSTL